MNEPRSAGAMGREFPYTLSTMCYVEVTRDGVVTWGTDSGTYDRVVAGDTRLYAVWPGQRSSHLFVIDDLDQYARALGIVHDDERTGLAEHDHRLRWSVSPYESNPNGSYVTVDVTLECGCEIRDLRVFARQMREQRGWDVATSTGWGGSGSHYSIRVRRSSLRQGVSPDSRP